MSGYWTDNDPVSPNERRCHPCYGSGEDDMGADCLFCDGYGTVLLV